MNTSVEPQKTAKPLTGVYLDHKPTNEEIQGYDVDTVIFVHGEAEK